MNGARLAPYLDEEGCSEEAQDYVVEILTYLNENDELLIDAILSLFLDEKIIDDTLPECIQEIVDEMISLESEPMADIISAFLPNTITQLNYDWNIVQTSNQDFFDGDNNLGATQSNLVGGDAFTRLNSVALEQATDLLYMQVLLHESYHAFLVNYIRNNIPPLYNSPEFEDYSYHEMITEALDNNNGIDLSDAQHNQFIRDDMVSKIAEAILEYATSKNYDVDYNYCEDLAWAGLQGTTTYNTELSQSRQDRIAEIILAEKENQTNGDQEPKGDTACE